MSNRYFRFRAIIGYAFLFLYLVIVSNIYVEATRLNRSIDTRYISSNTQPIDLNRIVYPIASETIPEAQNFQNFSHDEILSTSMLEVKQFDDTEDSSPYYDSSNSTTTTSNITIKTTTIATLTTSTTFKPAVNETSCPKEDSNVLFVVVLVIFTFLGLNTFGWLSYCYLYGARPVDHHYHYESGHKSVRRSTINTINSTAIKSSGGNRKSIIHKSNPIAPHKSLKGIRKSMRSDYTGTSIRSEMPIHSPKRLVYPTNDILSRVQDSNITAQPPKTPRSPIVLDKEPKEAKEAKEVRGTKGADHIARPHPIPSPRKMIQNQNPK